MSATFFPLFVQVIMSYSPKCRGDVSVDVISPCGTRSQVRQYYLIVLFIPCFIMLYVVCDQHLYRFGLYRTCILIPNS